MEIETKYLDMVDKICQHTEELSVTTWHSYIKFYYKGMSAVPSWDKFFRDTLTPLYVDSYKNPYVTKFSDEVVLNMFKISQSKNENDRKRFHARLQDTLIDYVNPALYTFERQWRRINKELVWLPIEPDEDTNLFIHLSRYHHGLKESFPHHYTLQLNREALGNAIDTISRWQQTITLALTPPATDTEPEKVINDVVPLPSGSSTSLEPSIVIGTMGTDAELEDKQLERRFELNWNGTNRSLYSLFAQLTLQETKERKPLLDNSIKEIAQFISAYFYKFPSALTVERELEKMRELNGIEKAKRGRIDLNISKE